MSGAGFLADEFGNSTGLSRHAIDLCCAIAEDAERARLFEYHRPGAAQLFWMGAPGHSNIPRESAPLASELTSLIA